MKRSFLIFSILSFIVVLCGCINPGSNMEDKIPSDKYVAIYEEYTNTSKLIGNTTYVPGWQSPIPGPIMPFDYNNSSGLISTFQFEAPIVNDSLKILYGKMIHIDNPNVYGDEGVFLSCIYDLPYTNENGFTIMNVTRNGTINAVYDNGPIILRPGDSWTSPITSGTTMGSYYTMDPRLYNSSNGILPYLPWPVSYNRSFTITNKGIYSKSLWNSTYTN